ncbi:DNA cytosine methyltransferase [Arthrobacter rhombi]|uniref:DNA cytosine methyltransferase n=1 Tax=Arthrobacter rhombi TaxID=71253 RepID=UPI0031D4F8A5
MLRAIEICAGAGGQALGLERAGFGHELAIELDEVAVSTLRANRPEWNVAHGDVADATVWNPADYAPSEGREPIDLFAGGVPCPPFSVAGKQLGAGDERDLFAWAVEQVAVLKPRAILLENVRGLSSPRFAAYRQHVLDRLREFGYVADWRLLNASDFGVPQLRPRFVLIALKPEDFAYFSWPQPISESVTVGQSLRSLMAARGWRGADEWAKSANKIGPTVVGGSKKHGGPDLGPTRAKAAWALLGVDAKGVANEAPGPEATFDVGPKLTCEMVARLQGWDEEVYSWRFEGKKTNMYRQIGNAFPPPVAFELGRCIAAALRHEGKGGETEAVSLEADPIYKVLRSATDFLTATQITRLAKVAIDPATFDKRMTLLGQDFELERQERSSGLAYRLGAFKAFTGQVSHSRHEYYKSHVSRVS